MRGLAGVAEIAGERRRRPGTRLRTKESLEGSRAHAPVAALLQDHGLADKQDLLALENTLLEFASNRRQSEV